MFSFQNTKMKLLSCPIVYSKKARPEKDVGFILCSLHKNARYLHLLFSRLITKISTISHPQIIKIKDHN